MFKSRAPLPQVLLGQKEKPPSAFGVSS